MFRPSNSLSRIKSDHVAALAVALAPIVYFFPAIRNHDVLCPDDGIIFNVPLRVAAAQIMKSGHLPLWNPYIFSGMPLLASAQGGLLFPLNWFYLVFSPAVATNAMVVSSYIVAALGAYLYARRTGASIAGAMTTSLIWQWSGFLVGQISHINIVQTAAMLPWVLWAVEGYAGRGNRARGALLAALVAIQAFAGHQQSFAYALMLVTAYAIVMALVNAQMRARYFSSLAYVAAGVLLAAVQILPTFELLRNSLRSEATYDFFTSFSMPRRFVMAFFAPYIMGGGDGRLFRATYIGEPFYAEFIGYAGALAIMLVLVALLLKPDARTKFWAVAAPVCLVLAFGNRVPLQFYRLIYHVPILNLFRVPARHMMEVEFAIAVLAGRGLTSLAAAREKKRVLLRVAIIGALVFLLTCLVVTWLRPANFHLGREAPVSVLRAPELFMPILFAGVGAWALWMFARRRRGSTVFLFAVLACDLILWGQSSGWYTSSPKSQEEFWRVPETVEFLRGVAPQSAAEYRILTAPHTFDPEIPPVGPSVSHASDWVLWTQPDVYMMYGIQNAAGYDGFGLERYGHLAGEMKVWGELTDPNTTLRGDSREIDLCNVRYLLSMRTQSGVRETGFTSTPADAFSLATEEHGGFMFARDDLGLPNLSAGKLLRFTVAPVEADRVALLTNLSWSENVPNGVAIGRVRLRAQDGRKFEFLLRAGIDSAEWSYDRPDIRARIRHKRPTVATSYEVKDAQGNYEAHTYVTSFALPEKVAIASGEIQVEPVAQSPNLLLSVFRMSLVNASENKTYSLRRESMQVESASTDAKSQESSEPKSDRWKLLTQTHDVDIYENARTLPRAWLASDARVLDESAMLEVIRTGKLPDGSKWEPLRTVLVEAAPANFAAATRSEGHAEITRYEPNEVDLKTEAGAASILVLSENHYPGWRAYVDGWRVDVMRVDYNLRGVMVPAGKHNVTFAYWPKSVMIGLLISLLTAAVLAILSVRVKLAQQVVVS
ncbi:MAG TPA: YfhO family protein [Pyrinomonadaceae bacterium]|nr:YfhO family protein [Pyrinomonadaceae bacterium]